MNEQNINKNILVNLLGTFNVTSITAGVALLLISLLMYLNEISIIRNFIFSAILGSIFLIIVLIKLKFLQLEKLDIDGIIIGISLIIVSVLIYFGKWEIIRTWSFWMIISILLLGTAMWGIKKGNLCSLIGGEALLLYSFLLYFDTVKIIWNFVFIGVLAVALITLSMAEYISNMSKNHSILYVDIEQKIQKIEKKIANLHLELDNLHSNNISTEKEKILKELEKVRTSIQKEKAKVQIKSEQSELYNLVLQRDKEALLNKVVNENSDIHGLSNIIKDAQKIKKNFD